MSQFLSLLVLTGLFSGCALVQPYAITFTTPDGSVVDPATDTLDLAVNPAAFAAVSSFQCGDEAAKDLFLTVPQGVMAQSAHNLSLAMLVGQAPGTKCDVTVSAFDTTTTSRTQSRLSLNILQLPTEEVAPVEATQAPTESSPAPESNPSPIDELPVQDEALPASDPAPATEEPSA